MGEFYSSGARYSIGEEINTSIRPYLDGRGHRRYRERIVGTVVAIYSNDCRERKGTVTDADDLIVVRPRDEGPCKHFTPREATQLEAA